MTFKTTVDEHLAGASRLEAPTRNTPRIQEFHILHYHHLCQQIEARLACTS